MTQAYTGPLRDEPLSIELHNTVYVAGGIPVDGLADARRADAWLDEIVARLPLDDYPPGPVAGGRRARRAERRRARRPARRSRRRPQDAGALEAIEPRRPGPRAVVTRCRPATVRTSGEALELPRSDSSRGRRGRIRAGCDRSRHGASARRAANLQGSRLRADVPRGPSTSRVVLECVRQPGETGTTLPAGSQRAR